MILNNYEFQLFIRYLDDNILGDVNDKKSTSICINVKY